MELGSGAYTANSSPVPLPLIFNLNHDVLLHIFKLNTHREIEDSPTSIDFIPKPFCPLNIARHTSQVCRPWRRIMLRSGAIWGSLIHMTIFENCSKKWAKLVLKRARKAPLSIYGKIEDRRGRNRHFFNSLLINQWYRVQKIDLAVQHSYREEHIDDEMWDVIFRQPAPMLETFILKGVYDMTTQYADDHRPLFNNSAPRLRRFHCRYIDAVNYNTTWFTQLTNLTVARTFNTLEILRLLCSAVSLQTLIIEDNTQLSATPALADWYTKIYLPDLQHLKISAEIDLCDIYLRSIVSHSGCSLIYKTRKPPNCFSSARFDALVDNFASYLKGTIVNRHPVSLYITIEPLHVIAAQYRPPANWYLASPAELDIRFGEEVNPPQVILENTPIHSRFISTLLSIPEPLKFITAFTFLANVNSSTSEQDEADFISLIPVLSSVTELYIQHETLKLLTDARLGGSVAFPLLDMLDLKKHPMGPKNGFSQELIAYLKYRKAAAVPLSTLSLGCYWAGIKAHFDWSFLDVFVGLKVEWDFNQVYICGSGDIGRLIWRKDEPKQNSSGTVS